MTKKEDPIEDPIIEGYYQSLCSITIMISKYINAIQKGKLVLVDDDEKTDKNHITIQDINKKIINAINSHTEIYEYLG